MEQLQQETIPDRNYRELACWEPKEMAQVPYFTCKKTKTEKGVERTWNYPKNQRILTIAIGQEDFISDDAGCMIDVNLKDPTVNTRDRWIGYDYSRDSSDGKKGSRTPPPRGLILKWHNKLLDGEWHNKMLHAEWETKEEKKEILASKTEEEKKEILAFDRLLRKKRIKVWSENPGFKHRMRRKMKIAMATERDIAYFGYHWIKEAFNDIGSLERPKQLDPRRVGIANGLMACLQLITTPPSEFSVESLTMLYTFSIEYHKGRFEEVKVSVRHSVNGNCAIITIERDLKKYYPLIAEYINETELKSVSSLIVFMVKLVKEVNINMMSDELMDASEQMSGSVLVRTISHKMVRGFKHKYWCTKARLMELGEHYGLHHGPWVITRRGKRKEEGQERRMESMDDGDVVIDEKEGNDTEENDKGENDKGENDTGENNKGVNDEDYIGSTQHLENMAYYQQDGSGNGSDEDVQMDENDAAFDY